MNKKEFLAELRRRLSGLPQDDIEERVSFYSEMIDDRMEEGLSELEAVGAIGSVDTIVQQIIGDTLITKQSNKKAKAKKRLKAWEIVLLVLGSPVWLSLLIAAFAVIISLYISLWAVIISLWAVFASFAACFPSGIMAGIIFAFVGNVPSGIAVIGAGIVCAGLSVFTFYGCKAATKGTLLLTKKITLGIKCCFIKKEEE